MYVVTLERSKQTAQTSKNKINEDACRKTTGKHACTVKPGGK
jgi:hypothetical protein